MDKKKTVKVKNVHVTNYKGIEELTQEIDGRHFIAFGKNGGGKSTLFEIINRSAQRIDPKKIADIPIKLGAKNAKTGVVYHVDEDGKTREILVEVSYRPSGAVMRVVDLSNDGELKPPVEKLLSIIGESFDLSGLMDMKPEEQFEEIFKLLSKLGGSEAHENYEAQYDKYYEERKDYNKDIKRIEGVIETNKPPLEVLTAHRTQGEYGEKKPYPNVEMPDKAKLVEERGQLANKNLTISAAIARKKEIEDSIKEYSEKLEAAKDRLQKANEWLDANKEQDLSDVERRIEKVGIDILNWQAERNEIDEYNRNVDKLIAYKGMLEEFEEVIKKRDEAQVNMDNVTKKMNESVASLNLSEIVPELTIINEIDESGSKPKVKRGVYYVLDKETNQVLPFNRRQISYGKCVVATAKLSSYVNAEKLNLVHIPAWNDLDAESKSEILKFAEENPDLNIQYGIEEVKDEMLGIRIIDTSEVVKPAPKKAKVKE